MANQIRTLCLLLIITALTVVARQANAQDQLVEVTILGTFHFGPTSDLASIRFDDIQTDRRQAEILEVVDLLSKYNPDKILLEYTYTNREKLQSDYQAFLEGEYELRINERDLIGFRLAKKLGHDSVFAIDHSLDLPFDQIVQYCQETDKMGEFNDFVQSVQSYTSLETEKLSNMPLPQYLAVMNSIAFDNLSNDLYLRATANFGEAGSEVGIDAAAEWWKRNMFILKNIDRVTQPGDKALLIIGQAHRAVLRDFIEARQDMSYNEVNNLLKQ